MVYWCAAQSPHIIDITLFKLGLHHQPSDLRKRLQKQIDATSQSDYDALILAYGLCGKATAGLVARDIPVVIPKAHDCITLFLGSRQRYQEQFEQCSGTYWYTQDYVERNTEAGTSLSLGSAADVNIHDVYEEYVQKYGKDNADYLMEVMGAWQQHYQRAVFIDMDIGDSTRVEQQTRDEAVRRQWTFEKMKGDLRLIRNLLAGEWENDFLILQPGQQLAMSYDENVVKSQDHDNELSS
jgi:hypothetical protein